MPISVNILYVFVKNATDRHICLKGFLFNNYIHDLFIQHYLVDALL